MALIKILGIIVNGTLNWLFTPSPAWEALTIPDDTWDVE
jgi:hypothetical protein